MKFMALLPALLHVFIFWLETWGWGKASSAKAFGVSADQVETLRPWAFNQGWYNLFLAAAVFGGLAWGGLGGTVLAAYGLGSMVAAALVLIVSSPAKARSAAIQGLPAVLGLVGLFWAW
jgi:putative membrane protein